MSTRGLGFMQMPVFSRIVEQIKDYAETVDLHLAGEPLLHPNIVEMISLCGKHGLKTVLHTNASFLNQKMADRILESPLTVIDISFDGATKETYEQIRLGGNYEQVLQNIEYYLDRKQQRRWRAPYTIIHMIYMNKNKNEINLFLKKWKRSGVDDVRIKAFNKTGLSAENRSLGVDQKLSFRAVKRKPCFMLWRFLVVHWDGTVVPCCLDFVGKEPLGNIMEEELEALWNNEKMKRFRTFHVQGKIDDLFLCKDCALPMMGTLLLLASVFVNNTTIKKRLLPMLECLWLLKKFKLFRYFSDS